MFLMNKRFSSISKIFIMISEAKFSFWFKKINFFVSKFILQLFLHEFIYYFYFSFWGKQFWITPIYIIGIIKFKNILNLLKVNVIFITGQKI